MTEVDSTTQQQIDDEAEMTLRDFRDVLVLLEAERVSPLEYPVLRRDTGLWRRRD